MQNREWLAHQNRLWTYEEKLQNGSWTLTHFLEASSFLFRELKMPRDEEGKRFDNQVTISQT